MNEQDRDRLLDLLADRAIEGLSENDERELAELLDRVPLEEAELFEDVLGQRTADSVTEPGDLSPELVRRITEEGERMVGGPTIPGPPAPPSPARRPWVERLSWLALGLLLAAGAAWWLRGGPNVVADEPTLAERRSRLLDGEDTLTRSWSAGPTAPEVGDDFDFGDVVWSRSEQEGYLRIRGLPVNDVTREQYQLWIFDETRDAAHPVDGGVFDVTDADGETIVAIDPKLAVREATLFAITVESPGGVVVSDRSRLPLLAKVDDAS